jgi:putative FmdB family regulatory protein
VPLYDYECLPHKHRFELRQSFGDEPAHECLVCGGQVRRVIHPVGVVFKGSGFYVTDSRKSTAISKSSKSDAPADKDGKTTTTGESKGDSKSESKKESAAS